MDSLSPGEVHFLRSFIQGSIMITETRRRLVLAWGMCQRHSLAALSVEAAYRHGYLHGPAILYSGLMARAPCLMCDLGYDPRSEGFISEKLLAAGREPTFLLEFMRATEDHWRETVCGVCAGDGSPARCRVHLCASLQGFAPADLAVQGALVARTARHLERFSRAFGWDERGSDTPADRAALVSAAGWCGGWGALLEFAHAGQHG